MLNTPWQVRHPGVDTLMQRDFTLMMPTLLILPRFSLGFWHS